MPLSWIKQKRSFIDGTKNLTNKNESILQPGIVIVNDYIRFSAFLLRSFRQFPLLCSKKYFPGDNSLVGTAHYSNKIPIPNSYKKNFPGNLYNSENRDTRCSFFICIRQMGKHSISAATYNLPSTIRSNE